MATKHHHHRRAGPDRLAVGNVVASPHGKLKGAGPFTTLIVTTVHRDGRLDIEGLDGAGTWTKVDPEWVVKVAESLLS